MNTQTRILRVISTGHDYWGREHFRDFDHDNNNDYRDVDGRIHTFEEEPEFPVRESLSVIEVDDLGQTVKVWQ